MPSYASGYELGRQSAEMEAQIVEEIRKSLVFESLIVVIQDNNAQVYLSRKDKFPICSLKVDVNIEQSGEESIIFSFNDGDSEKAFFDILDALEAVGFVVGKAFERISAK